MIRKMIMLAVILMIANSSIVYAQISFENSYPASAAITSLETDGNKYYVMDVVNSQCRLYNPDHSIWKVINITLPANNYLYDIQYVSQHLFDDDDLVEILVTYYEYIENGGNPYYIYGTKILKQNGEELLNVPGGGYSVVTELEGSAPKLLIYVYDFSVTPFTVSTNVYSINSTGSSFIKDNTSGPGSNMGDAYPNPADTYFIIPYELSKDAGQAELVISEPSGRVVRKYNVDHAFDHLKIQRNELPPGQYLYNLVTPGNQSKGKVIILR